MHHAMTHGRQCVLLDSLLDPIHQDGHCRRVIRCHHRPRKVVRLAWTFHRKAPLRQSYSFDSAFQNPAQDAVDFEQRELDARGTAVDGQDDGRG
jgi:hypothetical protein